MRKPAKPKAPAHLSAAAKTAWTGLLAGGESPVELVALEAIAVQVARARTAQTMVDSEGILVPGPKDDRVPHPALAVERAAHDQIRRWVEGRQVRPGSPAGKGASADADEGEATGGWAAGLSASVQHPTKP